MAPNRKGARARGKRGADEAFEAGSDSTRSEDNTPPLTSTRSQRSKKSAKRNDPNDEDDVPAPE